MAADLYITSADLATRVLSHLPPSSTVSLRPQLAAVHWPADRCQGRRSVSGIGETLRNTMSLKLNPRQPRGLAPCFGSQLVGQAMCDEDPINRTLIVCKHGLAYA